MSEKNIESIEKIFVKSKKIVAQSQPKNHIKETPSYLITRNLIQIMKEPYPKDYDRFSSDLQKELKEVWEDGTRILYSEITKEAYELRNSMELQDIWDNNVQIHLSRYIKEQSQNGNCNKDEILFLYKIYDHFNLSLLQYRALEEYEGFLRENIKEHESKLGKFNASLDKASKDMENLTTKVESFNFDIVSILGVFTGISFVTFGGLSFANELSNSLSSSQELLSFTYSTILIGLLLINALVILMQYVKSITKEEVRVRHLYRDSNGETGLLVKVNALFFLILLLLIIGIGNVT